MSNKEKKHNCHVYKIERVNKKTSWNTFTKHTYTLWKEVPAQTLRLKTILTI